MIWIAVGLLVPFLGSVIGASLVFFSKKGAGQGKLILGVAAGIMLAASIWSLIIPSIELVQQRGGIPFLPAAVGLVIGMVAFVIFDTLMPTAPMQSKKHQNKMLILSITIHNIPEGMAVGAVFAGFLAGGGEITLAAAVSLSIGVALQNIPEGAIVGLPLIRSGSVKKRAFCVGVLSGVVEPISALVTVALYMVVVAVLPYMLAFAAGAMIYVTLKELVPDVKDSSLGMIGIMVGFVFMMIMDLSL